MFGGDQDDDLRAMVFDLAEAVSKAYAELSIECSSVFLHLVWAHKVISNMCSLVIFTLCLVMLIIPIAQSRKDAVH